MPSQGVLDILRELDDGLPEQLDHCVRNILLGDHISPTSGL